MTAAPALPAELPAPSPAPGSLRCPRALPHQHVAPGADWQHSHSLKPSHAVGVNSRNRSSQIPAHLVSRCRRALGSSQMAGEPRPLPSGWGGGFKQFLGCGLPLPHSGDIHSPLQNYAQTPGRGWQPLTFQDGRAGPQHPGARSHQEIPGQTGWAQANITDCALSHPDPRRKGAWRTARGL